MKDQDSLSPGVGPSGAGPQRRLIAECRDWSVAEYVCTAGPDDQNFEERHEAFTIAAVVAGTFRYETNAGKSLLHPGCWLLGNYGDCFTCGHDHSRGDRCVGLHVSPEFFSEVAASRGATSQFRFVSPFLAAKLPEVSLLARACALAGRPERIELDEVVTRIIETVIGQQSGAHPGRRNVSARDERRISVVLHHLEDHFADMLDLDGLAELALMSKYHFLRTFRAVVGCSPYQYLIGLRLQRAAYCLMSSLDSITQIAQNCGFGDLSTFGAQFRRQFGENPSRFRVQHSLKAGVRRSAFPPSPPTPGRHG